MKPETKKQTQQGIKASMTAATADDVDQLSPVHDAVHVAHVHKIRRCISRASCRLQATNRLWRSGTRTRTLMSLRTRTTQFERRMRLERP